MVWESSSVPYALDALVAQATALTVPGGSLEGVDICEGLPVNQPSNERYLCIGMPTVDGQPAVEGTQEFVSIPGRERDENYSIFCAAFARSGGQSVKYERDRAFAIQRAVEGMLRPLVAGGDITLGGTVSWAHVTGRITYTPLQTKTGCLVQVYFEISVRNRLSGN